MLSWERNFFTQQCTNSRHTQKPPLAQIVFKALSGERVGGREPTGLVEVGDASQGAEGRAGAAPLAVPPVLAGPQEVLAAPVVRVLVQYPVALHHVDGGDVTGVESLVQVRAVILQLQVLAAEVGLLKDLHPVVAVVLREWTSKREKAKICFVAAKRSLRAMSKSTQIHTLKFLPLLFHSVLVNWPLFSLLSPHFYFFI